MRDRVISLLDLVALALVAPLLAVYRAGLMRYDTGGVLLAMIPGFAGIFVRRAWYSHTLAGCGAGLTVQHGSVLCEPQARLGDEVYVGFNVRVSLADIGDAVMLADHVSVLSGMSHYGIARRDIPMKDQPGVYTRVSIGEDCWIGDSVVVGADVAAHSIVGSGAVVTKTFEPWQILGGVPARQIGVRPDPVAAASNGAVAHPSV